MTDGWEVARAGGGAVVLSYDWSLCPLSYVFAEQASRRRPHRDEFALLSAIGVAIVNLVGGWADFPAVADLRNVDRGGNRLWFAGRTDAEIAVVANVNHLAASWEKYLQRPGLHGITVTGAMDRLCSSAEAVDLDLYSAVSELRT